MTREQLDAIRARVEAALTYERSEYVPEEGAYVSPATEGGDSAEMMTCPLCKGEGDVEGQRYDSKETYASTVVAYGIGKGLHLAEEWVENGPKDALALVAEVERLRDAHAMAVQVSGELCEKCGWAMRFPGKKCRCELLAEVERLKADPLPAAAWVREVERAAFQRGVAAMREAALGVIDCDDPECYCDGVLYAEHVRALPDPEDTP